MKSEAPKAVWMVWSRSDLPAVHQMGRGAWMWCAHGPHGSQSGIEDTADHAQYKAQAAAVVLEDARNWGKEKAA